MQSRIVRGEIDPIRLNPTEPRRFEGYLNHDRKSCLMMKAGILNPIRPIAFHIVKLAFTHVSI